MAIFVNYEGPKLATEQKQAVRSHVMVLVRGRQKESRKGQAPFSVPRLVSSGKRAGSGHLYVYTYIDLCVVRKWR